MLHQVPLETNMDDEENLGIVKSLNDRRDYRVIQLDNGLTALLISDLATKGDMKVQCDKNYTTDNKITTGDITNDMVTCEGIAGESDIDDDSDDEESSEDADDKASMNSSSDVEDKESSHSQRKNVNRETKLAAAALCVGVGSFSDPKELPGLAHFLEHMVFMGSEKYPDENSFDAFIKKHGGSTNASTDCERTVFKFDVRPKYLKETLDRFAQFFISPLMKKNSIEREIMAVDSEFQMSYQNDTARKMQILGSLTTEGHPLGKFLWGSEESLKKNPKIMGIDVYEYLRSFWKKMYSSNNMTLAVISNEHLDFLEEWIREIYSYIPKRDPPPPQDPQDSNHEFDASKFHKLYKVVPVKDIHQVEITWAFPCLDRYYRTKPLNYVSWLLGHEGRGSVLALLKKKGWATSLCCGNSGSGQEFNSIHSLFTCTIILTASGLENYLECITIVFQYIEMLRQAGPQESIFSEIKRIEDNNFRFKEEVDTDEYVEEIAECMQLYPVKDYLTGSDLMWDFDEKIINDIQIGLTPEKANIMVMSKTIGSECTETEKWFGTQFCSQVIDHALEHSWKNLNLHSELHLPEENAFIARNFDIIPCGTTSQFPVIVSECAKGKVWHKQDTKFLVPKAIYHFYLKSPLINQSPEAAVLAEMYALLLEFDLKDVAYAADVAGLRYRITVYECGIELSFGGFNDKLPLLFHKVIEHMVKFDADEVQFNMVKEQMTRAYYNRIIKPQKFVRATRLKILQQVKWTDVDKRGAISNVVPQNLKDFTRTLKSTLYVESLFQGNITAQDAVAHQEFLYRNLAFEPLSETLHPQIRVLQLPDGESVCKIKGCNKNDQNTVVTNYYQIGPASGEDLTYTNLLLDMMEEPCFDILRTQQQLGYSVFCTCRETFGILGFSLTVQTQAEKYSSDYVKERMDAFLEDFLAGRRSLDSNDFQNHVSSMIEIKKHEDLNLAEEVNRNWKEITDETYSFDRLVKQIGYLKRLTEETFIDWVAKTTAVQNVRKLSVQVLGHKRGENCDDTLSDDVSVILAEAQCLSPLPGTENGSTYISDIGNFKQNLSVYPVSKIR